MGQALYRKYRSKKLSDIVGQEHITTTLQNALNSQNISHAYLFTGPRGVGKTSVARILAHEVNNLSYENDEQHLDIIEIDAASNRRIDEIRELRERVHTAPTSSRYKVYIIDEAHMLTKEAFNALLKTLEEPPEHVIFILATTEAHKLPETIISRTQRFTFKPIDTTDAIHHLKTIAHDEGITIDNRALDLIVAHSSGSFRDSISLLDQARNITDNIKLNDVQRMLGIAPEKAITELTKILNVGTSADLVRLLTSLKNEGYQSSQIAKQLASLVRSSFLDNKAIIEKDKITLLLIKLLEVSASHDTDIALELALLPFVIDRLDIVQPSMQTAINEQTNTTKDESEVTLSKSNKKIKSTVISNLEETKKIVDKSDNKEPFLSRKLNDAVWQQTLLAIKAQYNTLYSVTKTAKPVFRDKELILGFDYQFHQKRILETKNSQIIMNIIKELTGENVSISCVLNMPAESNVENKHNSLTTDKNKKSDPIDTISSIFGSAEVIES